MEIIVNSVKDLPEIAKKIFDFAGDIKIWLFYGEMGAGKTTLIKSICHQKGVTDTVSSPTFSLVNEYLDAGKNTIYHFDFYRIKNQEEAMDIGVEEYFESNQLCLVEWPDKISDLIPHNFLEINLEVIIDEKRNLTLKHHG